MRSVKLPQVPDTSNASLACNTERGHFAVIALRAAVEAGTQGVLGPPIICDGAQLPLLFDHF